MTCYLYEATEATFAETLQALPEAQNVRFYSYQSLSDLEALDLDGCTHLIVSGTLSRIKALMLFARKRELSLGIVPLPNQSKLAKVLDLPLAKEAAFVKAGEISEKKIDLFFCNGVLVLNDLRVGNTSVLKEFEYDYIDEGISARLRHFWKSWRTKAALRHYAFKVTLDKNEEKYFSAVGIIGMDYDNRSWVASALKRHLGSGDGQHMLAVLAPTSLIQFYLIQPISWVFGRREEAKLPRSLGFIKSCESHIDCNETLEVLIDDNASLQTPITLTIESNALALGVGQKFWERQRSIKSDRKRIRLDNVPQDEEHINFLSKGLPLFEHASKEQYASLFGTLREEGTLGSTFMILLVLATAIATLGLFINSGSVIIGAMLLAPLMQPIVSLSMGVLRQDAHLQQSAVRTIGWGVMAVLAVASLISLLLPVHHLTEEMGGRLSPTILDLFVAIVSGVAAAYAKNNEKILGSLAGVAIAVALVPPIAVAGIGLGWGEWQMFGSAFLLFVTNLVGIVLAAAMTFMALGYSPVSIARKGLVTWMVIVGLVSIPLYSSFMQMRENARIQSILTNTYFEINGKRLELTHIEVLRHKSTPEVRCEVISSAVLRDEDKAYLRELIVGSIGREMEVIATFRYRLQRANHKAGDKS